MRQWNQNYTAERALRDVEYKIEMINLDMMKLEAKREAYNCVKERIIIETHIEASKI